MFVLDTNRPSKGFGEGNYTVAPIAGVSARDGSNENQTGGYNYGVIKTIVGTPINGIFAPYYISSMNYLNTNDFKIFVRVSSTLGGSMRIVTPEPITGKFSYFSIPFYVNVHGTINHGYTQVANTTSTIDVITVDPTTGAVSILGSQSFTDGNLRGANNAIGDFYLKKANILFTETDIENKYIGFQVSSVINSGNPDEISRRNLVFMVGQSSLPYGYFF